MRRSLMPLAFASLLVLAVLAVPAGADTIRLGTALTGSIAPGQSLELQVSFDPVDQSAPPLVSMDLYVRFTRLTVLSLSWADSMFESFEPYDPVEDTGDLALATGLCGPEGEGTCTDPGQEGDYQVNAVLVVPQVADSSRSRLFTLRFAPIGTAVTPWTLDVLGLLDSTTGESALYRDDPDGFAPVDYEVLPFGSDQRTDQKARVLVDTKVTDAPPPTPVPEPTTLALFGTGLLGGACRWTRRRRSHVLGDNGRR